MDNRNTDNLNDVLDDIRQLLGDCPEDFDEAEVIRGVSAKKPVETEKLVETVEPAIAGNAPELPRTTKVNHEKHAPRKRGMLPVWLVALIDALLVGVFLLTFAFFHHVLPAMISAREREEAKNHVVQTDPVEVKDPMDVTVPETDPPTEPPTEAPTEPDLRTEWQKKFEEHFSDEIIITENSYKSPNVSITVETITYGEGNKKQTYHVADIYIGSIENFTTYVAGGEGGYFNTQPVVEMSEASKALIAISGDFITYQRGGFLMRNGKIYAESTNNVSICALFPDGTIETYEDREFSIEDIKSRGAIQVWSFGPTLLDENGQVRKKYNVPQAVSYPNPRSAIGYYEPGHYCFVVVDGRQNGYAKGMTIPELAQVFVDLGCTKAYNLDGGGSAVMTFNHQKYSKQSNGGRDLGDILLIRETDEFLASIVPEETLPPETVAVEGETVSAEATAGSDVAATEEEIG